MKKKPGFRLNNVCGVNVLIAEGKENIDFSNIISMNESSAYLWKNIQGKDFTAETLADLLTDEYEVTREQALDDCNTLIKQWFEAGIII